MDYIYNLYLTDVRLTISRVRRKTNQVQLDLVRDNLRSRILILSLLQSLFIVWTII